MEMPIAVIVMWLVIVNIAAVLMTMWDKNRARRREWRVSESTLWVTAALGGAAAMFLTMFVIRHKTRHLSFMIGLPLLSVVQIAVLYLMFLFGYIVII